MLDIIIPCFNEPKYLDRLLTSIKRKTSDYIKINVYIVDDCSNYSTEYKELITLYNQYFKCFYLKTNKNSGPGIARNLGLQSSNDQYITFIDDDDIIIEDILSYCISGYDFIISEIKNWDKQTNKNFPYIKALCYINSIQGIVYNRNFINRYNLQLPNLSKGTEDSIFRVINFLLSKNIKIIENKSFYFRVYRSNSTFTKNYNLSKSTINRNSFNLLTELIWLSNLYLEIDKYINHFPQLKNEDFFIKNLLNILDYLINISYIINLSDEKNSKVNIKFLTEYYYLFFYFINNFLSIDLLIKFQQNNNISQIGLLFISLALVYTKNDNNLLITNFQDFILSKEYYIYLQMFDNFENCINLSLVTYTDMTNLINLYSGKYYENY